MERNLKKTYTNIYCHHFGKILSNYSLVGAILMMLILLGQAVFSFWTVLSFFFAIVIIIITLGAIFAIYPNFFNSMTGSGEAFSNLIKICYSAYPILFGLTLATAILSIVLLVFQKDKKETNRIAISSICAVVGLVLGILYFCGVLK